MSASMAKVNVVREVQPPALTCTVLRTARRKCRYGNGSQSASGEERLGESCNMIIKRETKDTLDLSAEISSQRIWKRKEPPEWVAPTYRVPHKRSSPVDKLLYFLLEYQPTNPTKK
jgi:hypothetical protein